MSKRDVEELLRALDRREATPEVLDTAADALRTLQAERNDLLRQVERHESGEAYRGRVRAAENARASLLHADMKVKSLEAENERLRRALGATSRQLRHWIAWKDGRAMHPQREKGDDALRIAARALEPETEGSDHD